MPSVSGTKSKRIHRHNAAPEAAGYYCIPSSSLQDKLKSEEELTKNGEQTEISVVNNTENVSEAIQALQILGYNKKEIDKAFEKIANTDVSVEELIKKGLSILAR